MSVYSIQRNADAAVVLSAAQVESLTRSDVSLSIGRVLIGEPLSLTTSDSPFAWGDAVKIKRDGDVWFSGRVNSLPRSLDGSSKRISFEVVDVWWWVANVPYQLSAPTGPEGTIVNKLKGRIDIASGTSATAIISSALSFAATASGGAFAVGTVSVPIVLPEDQLRDVTCEDVIKACLRLAPDAVSWIDHTATPPTINLVNNGLTTVTIPVTDLSALEVGPRPDLQVPGVQIIYEIAVVVDGVTHNDIVIDNAGSSSNPRALVVTIPVTGPTTTYLKQKVRCETIRDQPVAGSGAEYLEQLNYLKTHTPWLAKCRNVLIGNVTGITFNENNRPSPLRYLANPDPLGDGSYELEDPSDPDSDHIELDTSLSRELVEGAVTEWMTAIKAQAQDIRYWIKYELNEGSDADPVWVQKNWQQLYVHVLATNALTRTYQSIDSYDAGDEIPAGVADAYFDSVSALPYSGSATTEEQEYSRSLHPGMKLQISAGRSEWSTMEARIQSVNYDLKTRSTQLTFGPPEQLAIQSFSERMRALRPVQNGRVPYADRSVPGVAE